jgi:hypothetical protein
MEDVLESLQLSFGQVAWAISGGRAPDSITVDRLRYLRRLGVPFPKEGDRKRGSGNRQIYGFDHLVECAVGVYALRQRLKPAGVAKAQVDERTSLRGLAQEHFLSTPATAFAADWVKSRGTLKPPLGNEVFLRIHDKASETVGRYDAVSFEELATNPDFSFGDLIEHYPNGDMRPLVPLKRVMLPAVAWALEAPATRPGPQ